MCRPAGVDARLLAHMVGLGADVVGGDEPNDDNQACTQAQVDARRPSPAELLDEWKREWRRGGEWMRAWDGGLSIM